TAHGTADQAVSVASFDVLRAELTARGRDVVAERIDGADHGFRKPDDPPGGRGLEDILAKAAAWFHDRQSPMTLAIRKDLERMQGTWQPVVNPGDGKSPTGLAANMLITIDGDTRTVRAGDLVYTQSRFRLDPLATPQAIDVLVQTGPMRGQTLRGIYEV